MRDYRFQTKQKNFFLRWLKGLIVVFILIIGAVGAFYAIRELDLFKIKAIDVIGSDAVAKEAFLYELGTAVVTGNPLAELLGKENILVWNNRDFTSLYSKFPRLANIAISRDFLEGRVTVELKEKEKLAIWCLIPQESCYWIDGGGQIFDSAPKVKGRIVRVINDYSPNRDLKIGDKVLARDELNNLNKIFDFINDFNFSAKEWRVEDIKYKEVNVSLEDGPELRFGFNTDPTFSKSVLESLRDSSEWSKIRYIDLRIPNRIYYSR